MIALDPRAAARDARAASAARPATAVVHDAPQVRLVVFRLAPGQSVPLHRSRSTVLLTVLDGRGAILGDGEERPAGPGDVVAFDPDELHGMRAGDEPFHLLATIAPRPGDA